MSVLSIEHIRKSFDGLEVLNDISLQVEHGEVISVIGPSGSGKSTLLRCATLLERADSGEIRYGDDYALRTDAEGRAIYAAPGMLKIRRDTHRSLEIAPHADPAP